MEMLMVLFTLLLAYLIGSIPFGLLIVRFSTGKDIRSVESGRTGGTNAMRAAGFWAGLATALLDMLKAVFVVWLARWINPGAVWPVVLAPVAAVLGHNYSIFLLERNERGKLRLRGGAGGAPAAGGAMGLWIPSILIILPVGILILYLVGYASLATLSVAVSATIIFTYLTLAGMFPWQYILYGVLTGIILFISLRPNIRRLLDGTERLVGLRAKMKSRRNQVGLSKK